MSLREFMTKAISSFVTNYCQEAQERSLSSTPFAYLLFTLAMARGVRSLDAGIIGYVEPVLNPIWVFLFIGERPSGWAIMGGAIIIVSVVAHMLMSAKGKGWKVGAVEITPHE